MLSQYLKIDERNNYLWRVILWTMVAVYTITLPHVIFIYKSMARHFSKQSVGEIPVIIIYVLGITYLFAGFFVKKSFSHLVFLIPCTIIVYTVIIFEPNPNKHIHIPEYVILTWILFEALRIDYRGKGIFVLVFICSIMLGIIDEIEQGIYPDRFYGWQDMLINSASSFIGILTLIGLRSGSSGDWTWISSLKKFKMPIGVILFGVIVAVLTCTYLFQVQAKMAFWGVYPLWLTVLNSLFLILGLSVIVYLWTHHGNEGNLYNKVHTSLDTKTVTARLWVFCPLVILIIIHAHSIFIAFSGLAFV